MNDTENQMCDRCGEAPAVTIVERVMTTAGDYLAECVCGVCLADERDAAFDFNSDIDATIDEELFVSGPEEFCEGW